MLFDMKGKSEASFLCDIKVITLEPFPSHCGASVRQTAGWRDTKSRQRCYLFESHESEVLFLMFKRYSLTVERKQSPWEEESSQDKMEQSEKEWK